MSVLSILAGFAAFCVFAVKGDIDCSQQDSCNNGNYLCSGSGCAIDCTGEDSCDDSTFKCDASCTVDCNNEDACEDSTFEFVTLGGTVSVDCSNEDACEDARFIASNQTTLTILCDGSYACSNVYIEMKDTSTFSLSCQGEDACENIGCSCFTSGCETSGNVQCQNGGDVNIMKKSKKGNNKGKHIPFGKFGKHNDKAKDFAKKVKKSHTKAKKSLFH